MPETLELQQEARELETISSPELDKAVPAPVQPKQIPPMLRRQLRPPTNLSKWTKYLWRLRHQAQFLRLHVQIAFMMLVLWIGVEFTWFVRWLEKGGAGPAPPRPPGVEGFLPLSALISLKHWLLTGTLNHIHPAAVIIFAAIVLLGVLLKKSFCSWLCPVGFLSELHWKFGRWIFGGNWRLPRFLDWPLRSLKYLLLAFFLYAILLGMDLPALQAFIDSPYNRVADIKMFNFFAKLDRTGLITLGVLALLSLPIKNFWCRYLCPYGALLGFGSLFSPAKITRHASRCIDCKLCTKACPANIPVHCLPRVHSDECTACLACTQACPVKDTLELHLQRPGRHVPAPVLAVLIVGIFTAITGWAMLTGYWQNSLTPEEYLQHIQRMESYGHPGR